MEKYQFDSSTKSVLDKLRVPLGVYQFIDKRIVTVLLSDGFCDLFGFDNKDDAYYIMEHDMWRSTHPEDKARVANESYRFAIEGGNYEVHQDRRRSDARVHLVCLRGYIHHGKRR